MFDWQRFREPHAADRIHPFWFWNGEMSDEHIRHQIGEMADKGLGGFFICARQGLQIAYLSDEWFRKVRVAVEAAERHGLQVWLYDEYPYPSGIAGGEVTLEHPEAKHYTLTHHSQAVSGGERISVELPWARIVYAKAVPVTADGRKLWSEAIPIRSAIGNYQADPLFQKAGLTAYNQKRFFTYRTVLKLEWTAPAGEWEVLVVQEKEIDDFKYYGTFVDPCNREAMAAFIRLTHDKYAQHVGDYFGTTIKGMFTDEIGLLGSIPWSPRLADYFQDRCGYDLREYLHALLDPDAEDAPRIRYDYYQSVHLLLRDSYHKQVHDWCERHGLQYVAEVPSVRHTTQLYSHVPGGDTAHEKLGRSLDWILNKDAANLRSNAKMVSSLARQLGRERNLIECFHSVGWSMTLQDARWMIDRMAAQGTNFFNFHAFFYTVDGLAQHDAPPSQFLQNPYWKHFRSLGDYTGRISYVMSSGEAVIRAAVLQPTTSLWTHMGNPFHSFSYGGKRSEEKERLELLRSWWVRICNKLTVSGRDFDHLDPELLADAIIENGRIKLGQASYTTLIMPPMTNLESVAWDKIHAFLRQGGTVVSMGQLPYEKIEESRWSLNDVAATFGLPAPATASFWQPADTRRLPQWSKGERGAYYLPFEAKADAEPVLQVLTELLERESPLPVRLSPACGEYGLLMQARRMADDTALVFVSNQEGEKRDVTLHVKPQLWGESAEGQDVLRLQIRELSLDSGEAIPLPDALGAAAAIPLRLEPFEARLIELKRVPEAAANTGSAAGQADGIWLWEAEAKGPWQLKALNRNALRLDTFRLSVFGGQEASEASAPIAAGTVIAKTFIDQCADLSVTDNLPVRMSQMFGTPMRVQLAYPLTAVYMAEFTVEELPDNAVLLMDRSAIYGTAAIRLNGRTVRREDFRPTFLYDHNNVEADITSFLKSGETNALSVEVKVEHDWQGVVDALYIVGPFRVGFDRQDRPVLRRRQEDGERAASLQAGPYPGFPYYAGDFSFTRTISLPEKKMPAASVFEFTFRDLDPDFHDSAELLINGVSLGVRTWTPYRWSGDTSILRQGDNHIEVRATNTLIGMLEGKFFDDRTHAVRSVLEKEELRHDDE